MYKVTIGEDLKWFKTLDATLGIVVAKEGAFSFANGNSRELIIALYWLMKNVNAVCEEIAQKLNVTRDELDELLRSLQDEVCDGTDR